MVEVTKFRKVVNVIRYDCIPTISSKTASRVNPRD